MREVSNNKRQKLCVGCRRAKALREVWKSRCEVKQAYILAACWKRPLSICTQQALNINNKCKQQAPNNNTTANAQRHLAQRLPDLYPTRRLIALHREGDAALLEAHLKQEQGLKRDVGCKVRGCVPRPQGSGCWRRSRSSFPASSPRTSCT